MIRIATAAILIALSMGAVLPGAAWAGTAIVRHGDLNLATAQGVETLKARVQTAAETVCGPVQVDFGVSARTLYEAQTEQKACVRRTAAHALTQIQQARNSGVTRLARQ